MALSTSGRGDSERSIGTSIDVDALCGPRVVKFSISKVAAFLLCLEFVGIDV